MAIDHYQGERGKQKIVSVSNIIVNLLILGVFKYFNFFAESFAELLNSLGYQMDIVTLNVILPVGISFYTFQALSYTIDVYQRKIAPTKDVIQFFAYISFFPQLVAGPIERATNLLPQFNQTRQFDYARAVDGLRQMLWGFFKKVAVADICAYYVNMYWDFYDELSGLMLLQIAVLFTFQIYCDFSGYSDIAIGCAKLFGIRLMKNFDVPYFSRNISEFWRRWHISLMSWFRDYVYIPLGGNRCSYLRSMLNVFVVFLISGLWHGANWTFVTWGGYNSLLIILGNLIRWNKKYKDIAAKGKSLPSIYEVSKIILTFSFVVFGWIIFRAESLSETVSFFSAIITHIGSLKGFVMLYLPIFSILLLVLIEWIFRDKEHVLASSTGVFHYRAVRWLAYYIMVIAIYRSWGFSQEFIYFQF